MEIKEIPLNDLIPIRWEAMYANRPVELAMIEGDEKAIHLGLYLKGKPVTVISLFINGNSLQFRKFATLTNEQRNGYGSVLLKHVLSWTEKNNFKRIFCHARIEAISFYQKFGMVTNGSVFEKNGLKYVLMEKEFNSIKMEIIPAIDIIDGKCVRLTEGDYSQKKVYNEDPLEVACQFQDAGLRRLHLVDLDGAKAGEVKNWKVLERISGKTDLVIDFGGGIKKVEDVDVVFSSGAKLATVGSIAVKNEMELVGWFNHFGVEKFLLGADVKEEKIAIHGWLEKTDIDIIDFIQGYLKKGVKQIFCTDVSKDGKLEGPSVELYRKILKEFPELNFIASGGVSGMKDLFDLQNIGCKGAIVGKAIYENRITLKELEQFSLKN